MIRYNILHQLFYVSNLKKCIYFLFVLVNSTNKVGAVGFIPFIGELFYPVSLIRVDPETNEPIRDVNNLCIKCKVGKILISFFYQHF